MHLVLTGPSVRRKRHEQRHEQHHGPWPQTLTSPCVRTRLAGRLPTSAPIDQLSFPSVWREELLSLPSANVESHVGRSHASSTSERKLVAHPVGRIRRDDGTAW